MGKGHEWRPQRRRGFDDDNFSVEPPRRAPRSNFGARPMTEERPSGPPVQSKVKWFKAEKAFGFVELSDGSGDAFLHLSVLERGGFGAVAPGTSLLVRVSQGQKGAQVAEVLEVDASTASAAPPRERSYGESRPPRREREAGPAVEMRGTVKWYNAQKGFGFVVVPDGGKDVFLHASVLGQQGLSSVNEGQTLLMQVVQGTKGPEAVSVKLV